MCCAMKFEGLEHDGRWIEEIRVSGDLMFLSKLE